MKTSPKPAQTWPEIPLLDWEETKDTLHLFLQILGKIRLRLMPRKNHWWHATLFVSAQGITTGPMPCNGKTLELEINLLNHYLYIKTSEGEEKKIALYNGLSVGNFYRQLFQELATLNLPVKILAKPYDNKSTIPFAEDETHHQYDKEKVTQYFKALLQIDAILKEFSGRFYGKTCPVQIYWHHFDLTVTRFSGKKVPVNPEANVVEKDAYSHELISFGFWAGDDVVREPAFYSYTFPLPEGIEKQPLKPAAAKWVESNGSPMAYLSYEALRQESDPKKALLDFLESAYLAGAKLAKWPIEEWTVPPLEEL